MTLIADTKVYESSETVFNNSTRNCVVNELSIPGKAGYQISISNIGIDIANKKDGVLSTCYITAESNGKEKQLAKWSNSKKDYTPRSESIDYVTPAGCDVKFRVNLKTADRNYNALVRNFLGAWKYTPVDSGSNEEPEETEEPEEEAEPVEESEEYIVVKCTSGIVDQVIAEIQKIAPDAKISTLSNNT